MRIEFSKQTLDYLTYKYPQLTESIIQYFLFCGKIQKKYFDVYKLNKYEHTRSSYHVLKIPKDLAEEYGVDNELDLIPDDNGIIYKVYIDK